MPKTSSQKLNIVDAVRKRPGMYFGNPGGQAVNHAIYEVVANSVDQYLCGAATKVKLEINDHSIRVTDDGAGLPFDKEAPNKNYSNLVEYYLTNRHDLATADNHAPHIHLIGGGLGLAVVNAVSEKVEIRSSNSSTTYRQIFSRGKIVSEATLEKNSTQAGTSIEIILDKEIFADYGADKNQLRKTMFELAHFYPGLIVEYQQERFHTENGLLDLAYIHYNKTSFSETHTPTEFFYKGKHKEVQLQIAALGESNKSSEYLSWVNGSSTLKGGTHITGLKDIFRLANWNPDIVLIHVIMHNPSFAGPTKDSLSSKEVIDAIEKLVREPVLTFRKTLIRTDQL